MLKERSHTYNQPIWIMQYPNLIVFLSASELNSPLPLPLSPQFLWTGRCFWRCAWNCGHMPPNAYLCLFLNSWCCFLKVWFGPTRVSSSSKLLATLVFTAVTWVVVNMMRNSCYGPKLCARVSSSLGSTRMCRKHEQYLKVYLVCLLLLRVDGPAHSKVNHGGWRSPLHSSPTHSKCFPRAQPWCIFQTAHLSVLLSLQQGRGGGGSVSLPLSGFCRCWRSMHSLLLPILFSFWYPAFIKEGQFEEGQGSKGLHANRK